MRSKNYEIFGDVLYGRPLTTRHPFHGRCCLDSPLNLSPIDWIRRRVIRIASRVRWFLASAVLKAAPLHCVGEMWMFRQAELPHCPQRRQPWLCRNQTGNDTSPTSRRYLKLCFLHKLLSCTWRSLLRICSISRDTHYFELKLFFSSTTITQQQLHLKPYLRRFT